MDTQNKPDDLAPDPAAVFGAAYSLWNACDASANNTASFNLSEAYNGFDQFMREVMRIANQFESWACQHVDFTQLTEVWPYFVQDKFGDACLAVMELDGLAEFNELDCLRVALQLRLPVRFTEQLPIPVDVMVPNPVSDSAFRAYRIQTVRNISDGECAPYSAADDPADEEFGDPYFALYRVTTDGLLEHIADRATYREAVGLVVELAPGIEFPSSPIVCYGGSSALN